MIILFNSPNDGYLCWITFDNKIIVFLFDRHIVRRVWSKDDEVTNIEDSMTNSAMEILKMAALCTDVTVEQEDDDLVIKGDPTEVAIVRAVEEN